MASVGQVSAQRAARDARRVPETLVEPGRDVGGEAAADRGERERPLDLVAGAHAAPAGDAQLVLEGQVRMALVVLVRALRPGQRGSPTSSMRATCASSVCSAGSAGSSESTSSTTAVATRRAVASCVSTFIPSRTTVVHDGSGPGAPSTPTRHTRHAPNGA